MEESTSREKVLKKIRNALISRHESTFPSLDIESSIYTVPVDSPDITFAQEFTKVGGQFIYCENRAELTKNLISLVAEENWENIWCKEPSVIEILNDSGIPSKSDFTGVFDMKAGFTSCEFLIARLGSIMISSRQASGRKLNVFPENHVVIAKVSQIVPDLKDAFKKMKEKYSSNLPSLITVITGPSRTADIEKTLVMGAHGPKKLYVFLLDEE